MPLPRYPRGIAVTQQPETKRRGHSCDALPYLFGRSITEYQWLKPIRGHSCDATYPQIGQALDLDKPFQA